MTNRSQRLPPPVGHYALSGIFDDKKIMAGGNFHDAIHLAAYSGIMDRHDGAGAISDGCLNQSFIKGQRIVMDVHKHRNGSSHNKRALAVETKVNEGIMTSSPGCISARSAAISRAAVHEWVNNALFTAPLPFKPGMAFPGEWTVTGEHPVEVGFGNIVQFLAGHV